MNNYFIDQSWLLKFTPINEFVDVKILVPFLKVSQDIHVRSLLGESLYDDVLTKYVSATMSSAETQLVDLIKPSLAYDMVARNMPFISTQIRGAGVIKTNNANITQADFKEVKDLEYRVQSIANYYSQRVINFLCENRSLFPLWSSDADPVANSKTRMGGFYWQDDCGCPENNCGCH